MYYFCTYFDHRYLSRGLALYQSLRRHCPSFQLWILCLDRPCYDVLLELRLPSVRVIPLEEFEKGDRDLLIAKQNRSMIEYYFTCTPSLPLFIFKNYPEVDLITYLDADLFFFSDPTPIYREISGHSIAIIAHRFPPTLRGLDQHGIYNVGWVSFRRDEHAFTCLNWWRDRCIEWCYDRCEDGRFADQKYLDNWPSLFRGVIVLCHKGANVAPWNLANHRIRQNGRHVWVDDQPLIFFHFHNFRQITEWMYDTNLANFKVRLSGAMRRGIYLPYVRTLLEVTRPLSHLLQGYAIGSSGREQVVQAPGDVPLFRPAVIWSRRLGSVVRSILAGELLLVVKGRRCKKEHTSA